MGTAHHMEIDPLQFGALQLWRKMPTPTIFFRQRCFACFRWEYPAVATSLVIYLPMGSPPGNYELRITGAQNHPPLGAAGVARIEAGNTVLRVRLDLGKLPAGRYSLGIRQPPWDWRYYPLALQ